MFRECRQRAALAGCQLSPGLYQSFSATLYQRFSPKLYQSCRDAFLVKPNDQAIFSAKYLLILGVIRNPETQMFLPPFLQF